MRVIKEKDVIDGFTRRIHYHIPRATREVDRMEYTGLKHSAYCGYTEKGHLIEKDFTEYELTGGLPEGEFICGDCIYEMKESGFGHPSKQIYDGEITDPRRTKPDG